MSKRKYNVVGVTFEHRQDILSNFYKTYRHGGYYNVALIKEDDNPYDKNAISVNLEVNGKVECVGFISKNENVELRTMMDNIIDAKVHSIGPNRNSDLGLNIDVEFKD